MKQYAAHYIDRLRAGEDVFFPLIEAEDAIVPVLIDAFGKEQDSDVRAALVEIIWQRRLPQTVVFLSKALIDGAPEVWKNALDGLVALGGADALEALESARDRSLSHGQKETVQVDWIDEAIQQIREAEH